MALRGSSLLNIEATAREIGEQGQLGRADALAVSLAILKAEQTDRYKRAALRWQARYLLEVRPSPEEAALVSTALMALGGGWREAQAAAEALVVLFEGRGMRHEAEYLSEYAERFS